MNEEAAYSDAQNVAPKKASVGTSESALDITIEETRCSMQHARGSIPLPARPRLPQSRAAPRAQTHHLRDPARQRYFHPTAQLVRLAAPHQLLEVHHQAISQRHFLTAVAQLWDELILRVVYLADRAQQQPFQLPWPGQLSAVLPSIRRSLLLPRGFA